MAKTENVSQNIKMPVSRYPRLPQMQNIPQPQ